MIWMPGYKHFHGSGDDFQNTTSLLLLGSPTEESMGNVLGRENHLFGGGTSCTFSFWVRFEDVGEYENIFPVVAENITVVENTLMKYVSHKIVVEVLEEHENEDTSYTIHVYVGITIVDLITSTNTSYILRAEVNFDEYNDVYQKWFHVVIQIDTTEQEATDRAVFYINGIKLNTISEGYPIPQNFILNFTDAGHLLIGQVSLAPVPGDKIIDELAFFADRVVPIEDLHVNSKPRDISHLFNNPADFWLRFETGDVNTVGLDSSPNANNFQALVSAEGYPVTPITSENFVEIVP